LSIVTAPASTFRNVDNYENFYYYLTHTRGAPWFIGIILGYCIFKLKENELILKLNKFVIWIIWGVCFATMLACSLGGYNTLVGEEYDRWGSAFHIALVRPVWSLAISWIILACTNNYGGEKKTQKNEIPLNCFQAQSTGYYHSLSSKYLTGLPIVSTWFT
jgi:hypothetical protein